MTTPATSDLYQRALIVLELYGRQLAGTREWEQAEMSSGRSTRGRRRRGRAPVDPP